MFVAPIALGAVGTCQLQLLQPLALLKDFISIGATSYNYCNQATKVFLSRFTSAGVAAGSIAAATQAGIGDFHFCLNFMSSLAL